MVAPLFVTVFTNDQARFRVRRPEGRAKPETPQESALPIPRRPEAIAVARRGPTPRPKCDRRPSNRKADQGKRPATFGWRGGRVRNVVPLPLVGVHPAEGARPKGQRSIKTEGTKTTYYFFSDFEQEYTAGTLTNTFKYYSANNQKIAQRSTAGPNSGTNYILSDHLGSSTVLTNTSGTVIRTQSYKPYGADDAVTGTGMTKYQYTGQEKDTGGLYYYNARYYDPELGRFTQPDPAVWDPMQKAKLTIEERLNPYLYALNNPVKYTDPTGLDAMAEFLFAISHPIPAAAIGSYVKGSTNISTNAIRFSTNLELRENASREGSEVNAVRHTLWSATVAKAFGASVAIAATNAHEPNPDVLRNNPTQNFASSSEADSAVDILNNSIGRYVAQNS